MNACPENLCLIPFSSLHIAPNGSLRLCPSSLKEIGNLSDTSSLSDLWNSDEYQTIRSQMQANQRPKVCEGGCYRLEDRGVESHRLTYNKKYGKIAQASVIEGQNLLPTNRLKHVDISFSNICNLNCAMCSSLYSSSWFQLEQEAVQNGIDFRPQPTSPFRSSPEITQQILDSISNVERMIIKGGEPFADPNCLLFLEKIAEKRSQLHPNLTIYIQTNGTILNKSLLALFRALPIELGVSIDGAGKTYEWIRGFSFDKISSNIKTLCTDSGLRNIHLNFTLSAFNVLNISEMLDFYLDQAAVLPTLGNFYFSSIAKQHWSNPLGVPFHLRAQALQNLERKLQQGFAGIRDQQRVLQFLALPDDATAQTRVRQWVSFMNKKRGFSLSETNELYQSFL